LVDCGRLGDVITRSGGPGDVLARHRAVRAVAMSAAGTALGIFARRARTAPRRSARLFWAALAVLEAVQLVGMWRLRDRR
jgi:hypothetical protein